MPPGPTNDWPSAGPEPKAGLKSACCKPASGSRSTLRGGPADETVSRPQVSRRRRPCQASDGLASAIDQILDMLPDRPAIPQIVMGLEQPAKERLFRSAAHLPNLQHPQLGQITFQRRDLQGRLQQWCPVPCRVVGHGLSLGRQDNQPGPVQLQHETAGHHVAQLTVGLDPVPVLAKLGRKPPPTQPGMIGDQPPDGFNFGATDIAPAVTKFRLHDRQHRRSILERKPIVEPFLQANPAPLTRRRNRPPQRHGLGAGGPGIPQQRLELMGVQPEGRWFRVGRPPGKAPGGKAFLT